MTNYEINNKAERREKKRRKKKYGMKVSGRSVKLIEKIKHERAEELKKRKK